jgi:hypothetical protein
LIYEISYLILQRIQFKQAIKLMKKEIKNRIIVAHGANGKIAKAFGVTNAMVGKALHGRGDSDLSKKIRYVAITQYEGQEVQLAPQNNNTNC